MEAFPNDAQNKQVFSESTPLVVLLEDLSAKSEFFSLTKLDQLQFT